MQPTYKERWELIVDGKSCILNEREMAVLKRAQTNNLKGVWFSDMYISLPHISLITLVERTIQEQISAPNLEPPTPEEMQHTEAIKQQIREKVKTFKSNSTDDTFEQAQRIFK